MASEAEVELVISTANSLPQLERDLDAIITRAENDADSIDLEAALALSASLSNVAEDIGRVIDQAEAGASEIELQAALDAGRSLSEIQGQLERVIGQAERGEAIEIPAELEPGALGDVARQVRALVNEVEAVTPDIEVEVTVDRDGRGASAFGALGRAAMSALPSIGNAAGSLLKLGPAAAAGANALAAVAAAAQQLGPAAAVAVPAMTSMILISTTLKLAMQGVGDAVSAAFDPDTKPEELEKALQKLAPEARKFVTELRGMRGELKEVQQAVQNNFFQGFSGALKELGQTTLPIVSNALQNTARRLNSMALGAAAAASQLAKDGTLGQALSAANVGLFNLEKIPAQIVTGLGQIGAAAAPAFDRITEGAAKAATSISKKLAAAFESGALESAIDAAIDAVAQLGSSIGNIFKGLGNITSALSASGEGLFATLEKITQAFADVTATKGFQDALKALSNVLTVLVNTALPLLSQALQVLGPVFQELGPIVELLVVALGDALKPIIAALGPVLVALAGAIGGVVAILNPLLEVVGVLIAAALPVLTPLLDAVGSALRSLAPFVRQVGDLLATILVPLFNQLATDILPKLLPPLLQMGTSLIPVLSQVLTDLSPSLIALGAALGEVFVAMGPLIVAVVEVTAKLFEGLMPVIQPLISLLLKLVTGALAVLVFQLLNIVVPAIQVLVDLLRGDFDAAWKGVQNIVSNVSGKVGDLVERMKDRVRAEMDRLAVAVQQKMDEVAQRIRDGFQRAVDWAREKVSQIPGIVQSELSNAGNLLFAAGTQIIQGLIDGLNSRLSRLREIASDIASTIKTGVEGFLGIKSPSRVMMGVGEDTIKGFEIGISNAIPSLRKELQGVASLAPSFALPNGGTLRLPSFSPGAPTVQVFLGNELVNNHIDTRLTEFSRARDRIGAQGVRR